MSDFKLFISLRQLFLEILLLILKLLVNPLLFLLIELFQIVKLLIRPRLLLAEDLVSLRFFSLQIFFQGGDFNSVPIFDLVYGFLLLLFQLSVRGLELLFEITGLFELFIHGR